MKVLFIYTDMGIAVGYSCGIGILSACLKKVGHETKLIHVSDELGYPLDMKQIIKDVTEYNPGLICFSATTNQWFYAKKIVDALREICCIPIVVGGHHANAVPEDIIKEKGVDFVCKGEGDTALPKLASHIEKKLPFEEVDNILWKGNGLIHTNRVGSWAQDLDTLPFEDRSLFDYGRIVDCRDGWAEAIATRGCPYQCSYCFNQPLFEQYQNDHNGKEDNKLTKRSFLRRRSVDSTLEMLHGIKTKYPNVKGFTFVDDIFTLEKAWLTKFCKKYKEDFKLPFVCTSQPNLFNKNAARSLSEAGCKVVKMGIECGDEKLRKQVLMRNITDSALIKIFKTAQEYGLKPQAFNMIGLPTETKEGILKTVELNSIIRPYIVWVSTFMPYPGTGLYNFCKKHNLINEEKWDVISSYREDSVLKDNYISAMDFRKIRIMFKWYLNANLGDKVAKVYQRQIGEFNKMDDDRWLNGEVEKIYAERDEELDLLLRKQRLDHYITKKYMYIYWGKIYNYDLS